MVAAAVDSTTQNGDPMAKSPVGKAIAPLPIAFCTAALWYFEPQDFRDGEPQSQGDRR
jgi:hypothetical protein